MDPLSQPRAETSLSNHGTKFSEKIAIFSQDFLKCALYITDLPSTEAHFTQKFYSTLASSSTLVEDFLDYHGAKNNKNWYFFRELTASLRHIGLALHPYTQGLLRAIPRNVRRQQALEGIPGFIPNLVTPPPGCRFHPRCPQAMELCRAVKPAPVEVASGHTVSCHLFPAAVAERAG